MSKALQDFLAANPLSDSNAWIAQMMAQPDHELRMLALRILEVRRSYGEQEFDFDEMKQHALGQLVMDNEKLMGDFMEDSMSHEECSPSSSATAVLRSSSSSDFMDVWEEFTERPRTRVSRHGNNNNNNNNNGTISLPREENGLERRSPPPSSPRKAAVVVTPSPSDSAGREMKGERLSRLSVTDALMSID